MMVWKRVKMIEYNLRHPRMLALMLKGIVEEKKTGEEGNE